MANLYVRSFIALFFIAFFSAGCDPKTKEYVPEPISGNLYYQNSLLGYADNIPLPNTPIYLSDSANFSRYLISTKSDSTAAFKFEHRSGDDLYLYSECTINNIHYSRILPIGKGRFTGNLILLPDTNQGLIVQVIDEASQPVNNVSVCLFTNAAIAASGNCSGAIISATTNSLGKCYFNNLPGNTTYYINVKETVGSFMLSGNTTVTVTPGGSIQQIATVTVTRSYSPKLKLKTVDNLNNILTGLHICLFTSQSLRDTKNCTNAIANGITSANGEVEFTGLTNTTYYPYINDTINGYVYTDNGNPIPFNPNSLTDNTSTITITRTPLNTLTVLAKDDFSSPFNGLKISVLTNATFAYSGNSNAAIATQKTNNLGKAVFNNLPLGVKYYLLVRDTIGQVALNGLDSVTFSTSPASAPILVK